MGVVSRMLRPIICLADIKEGIVWKYHVDHLKLLHETYAKVAPYNSQVQQDDTELYTTGGIE